MPEIFSVKLGGLKGKSIMWGKRNLLHTSLISHGRIWWIYYNWIKLVKLVLIPDSFSTSSRSSTQDNQRLFNLQNDHQDHSFSVHPSYNMFNVCLMLPPANLPGITLERAPFIRIGKDSSKTGQLQLQLEPSKSILVSETRHKEAQFFISFIS